MKLRITTSQCIQCDGPLYQPPLSSLFNEGLLPVRSCSKLEITAPCPAYLAPARKPAWSVNLPTRNGTTELVPTVNRKGVANVNFLSRFCLPVLPFLQNVLAWEVSWKWHDWIRGEVWRENPCCSVLKARESLYMLLRVSTSWRKKLTVPSPWSSNFQNLVRGQLREPNSHAVSRIGSALFNYSTCWQWRRLLWTARTFQEFQNSWKYIRVNEL